MSDFLPIFVGPENGAGTARGAIPGGFADLSAKIRKFFENLDFSRVKYLLSAGIVTMFVQLVSGTSAPRGMIFASAADTHLVAAADSTAVHALEGRPAAPSSSQTRQRSGRREQIRSAREAARRSEASDTLMPQRPDSAASAPFDSPAAQQTGTPPAAVAPRRDTAAPRSAKPFLDDPISGQNTDSLVYDVENKMVYI